MASLVDGKRYRAEVTVKKHLDSLWNDSRELSAVMEPKNSQRFKHLVRDSIPDDIRCIVWSKILGLDSLQDIERDYAGALKTYHIDASESKKQLDKFPTFGGVLHLDRFALSAKGAAVAKNILRLVAIEMPHVEYCPFLPSVVALLLHHLSADDALAAVRTMLKRSLVQQQKQQQQQWLYFPTTLDGTMQFYNAFGELVVRHAPRTYKHLRKLDSDAAPLWIKWLDSFLTDVVSLQTAMRLLDSYLVEGYKIIYRYGVAAIMQRETQILDARTVDQVEQLFDKSVFEFRDDDQLSRTAFSFSFSRTDVQRITLKNKAKNHPTNTSGTAIDNGAVNRLLPAVRTPSAFMKDEQWAYVWSWVHKRYRHMDLDQLFTTEHHGYNLEALYTRCAEHDPQLLLIETTRGEILGAFLSDSWDKNTVHNKYFGSAETFVFSLVPRDGAYMWVGTNLSADVTAERRREISENGSLYIFGNGDYLAIGGGGTHNAITLDRSLTRGTTGRCLTYNNPPLTQDGQLSFEVRRVEVYSFHE